MRLEARPPAGLRVIAWVAVGICVGILAIAFGIFVLAASEEGRDVAKAAGIVASGIALIGAIAWVARVGMRA
jgi:uncharacterized membrane protein